VDGVTVRGPFNPTGVSETLSRQKVFVCHPAGRPEGRPLQDERACARRIADNLARRAFRRPVTADEAESLLPYFDEGRKLPGGFDTGVEHLIAAVLVSPEFLYRGAGGSGGSKDPQLRTFALNDLQLASRLSFFLWSQGPDDALLKVATAGRLGDPAVLRAQAPRMLKDPRAASLVRNFALKSFDLDTLSEAQPDPNLFPTFTELLRQDMATEAESFLSSVLLEDRNIGDLLTANHTFLNERLARHYGIKTVFGPQFRRVTVEEPYRWGLLGKGAMLLHTSYGNRTSPVLRGAWVMGKLMGTPPTPPPPDVDTDLSQPKGEAPKTLRARLESHRSKPGCRQCHGVIDPIGLALENYDAIGRWRTTDEGLPIDASISVSFLDEGPLATSTPVDALKGFTGSMRFKQCFVRQLFRFYMGRDELPADDPLLRQMFFGFATNDAQDIVQLLRVLATSSGFSQRTEAP
jgi:hypothetical protein